MSQHDFRIENNTGRAVRTDFNKAVKALVTNNSGITEPPAPYAGMLWLDLSVLPSGQMRQRNQSNTGWINMIGVPLKASDADVITGTDDTMYVTPSTLDEKLDHQEPGVMNRLINPAMQIAQEGTSFANALGGVVYPVDQWQANGATGANFTASQVALLTPRKSSFRLRAVATAAKTPLVTGDSANLVQPVEGLRIDDLRFGSAQAKQVIARFGFKAPAGNYTFSLRNGTRCYLHPFTITAPQANADTEQVFVIPGDTAGTWATDNSLGIQFGVNIGSGATFTSATVDAWQNGNFTAAAGSSNGLATIANTFELFDCGLYQDVSEMGTAPRWSYPDFGEQLLLCQRYFVGYAYAMYSGLTAAAGVTFYTLTPLPADLRIATPALSGIVGTANAGFTNAIGTLTAVLNQNGVCRAVRESRVSAAVQNNAFFDSHLVVNARL